MNGLIAFTIRADGTVVFPDGDNSMVSAYGLNILGGDTIELRVKNISSELIVKKIDDSGQNVLAPVEFTLSKNGKIVETKTTDAATSQVSFKLEANTTYTLEETKAADGYLKSTNVYTVKVSATGEVQVTLDSKPVPHTPLVVSNVKKHEFSIDKVSINKETLAGARLKLKAKDSTASQPEIKDGTTFSASTDSKDKSVVWTSSATGAARFMLTPGVYTVSEEKAPENYLPFTAFDVQVKKDGSLAILDSNGREQDTNGFATVEKNNKVVLRLINHAPKLRIKKVDFYNPEKMLSGATFKLYKSDNKTQIGQELTTSETGVIEFPAIAPGIYYLEESKAPEGYQVNRIRYKVIVAADYTVSVENPNDLIEAGSSQTEGVHTIMPLTVKNLKNGEFPKTGGLGTALFYGFGATLMLLAVLYRRIKKA